MKAPWEWVEEDIRAHIINQVKESIELDYKACDALQKTDRSRDDISKDVSSFANAGGGTMVYGVTEQNNLPLAIDVGFDPAQITREWLEQVINSRIQRRIDGVRINQVDLPTERPGRVLYVVHIPQSTRAPHMASDHRFYKRFNFQAMQMEEYEVRDVARRSETPDLHLHWQLRPDPQPLRFTDGQANSEPVALTGVLINRAAAPANVIHARVYFDERLTIEAPGDLKITGERIEVSLPDGRYFALKAFAHNRSPMGQLPVWAGIPFSLTPTPIQVRVPPELGPYLIGWALFAPGMEPRGRYVLLMSAFGTVGIAGQPAPADVATALHSVILPPATS